MRIIAAEIPRHRDHLAIALAVSLVVCLALAIAVVLMPRPAGSVRSLEHARTLRTQAVEDRARRSALAPVTITPDVVMPTPPAQPARATPPSREAPAFVCRYPDRDQVLAWFNERVRPVLKACATEHPPAAPIHGALTITFDEVGLVERAAFARVPPTFAACAAPAVEELAHPDAFELTFTWPFVLTP